MKPIEQQLQELMNTPSHLLSSFALGTLIPVNYLDWFEPFQNFLIASAIEVLKNPFYSAWYLRQSIAEHRMVVLDAENLNIEEIFNTALRITASAIISPIFNDAAFQKTISTALELNEIVDDSSAIIGICHGQTIPEGVQCFRSYLDNDISMIGFNNTPLRCELIQALSDLHLLEQRDTYFLHGCRSIADLIKIGGVGEYEWFLYSNVPVISMLHDIEITENTDQIFEQESYSIGADVKFTDKQIYNLTVSTVKYRSLLPSRDDDCDEEEDDDE